MPGFAGSIRCCFSQSNCDGDMDLDKSRYALFLSASDSRFLAAASNSFCQSIGGVVGAVSIGGAIAKSDGLFLLEALRVSGIEEIGILRASLIGGAIRGRKYTSKVWVASLLRKIGLPFCIRASIKKPCNRRTSRSSAAFRLRASISSNVESLPFCPCL